MALEDHATGNRERQLLTECPACGADLSGKTKTSNHFHQEHLPEDFGLTPLGEISEDFQTPLFDTGIDASTETPSQRLVTDGGTNLPNNTRHAEQRWHERATDPAVGPVAAWTRADRLVGHGLDAHEARYDHETETVLLRKNDNLTTVLDASTPRASVARALDRLGYTEGGEQA